MRTSASAAASEVTFVQLPADAHNIRYWNDGYNKLVTFETTEDAFLKAFSDTYQFVPISQPEPYYSKAYGNPKRAPWEQRMDVVAHDGLKFEVNLDGGAGTDIIYDRERGTGFYHTASW